MFEELMKDFLEVIDFDLCGLDDKKAKIYDKLNDFDYELECPIDFTSCDSLRAFRCNIINDYKMVEIMNTKFPEHPFTKNGIDMFELKYRKGGTSKYDDDMFSSEIFYDGSLYISFIGRSLNEDHVCYRKLNHNGYIDVLYTINKEEKKLELIFNQDKKTENRISIKVPLNDTNQKAILLVQEQLFLQEEKQEVYRQELANEEIEDYIHALLFKATRVIIKTHSITRFLNNNVFKKVFDYFAIAKEFKTVFDSSKKSNEIIDKLFKKYFNSEEFGDFEKRIAIMQEFILRHFSLKEKVLEEREEFNDDMVLGTFGGSISQMIRGDFENDDVGVIVEGPTKVLNRSEEERIQHISEMIRKDFEEE